MADDGPQERPPFNDPKDPRWYSDPNRPASGYPGQSSSSPGSAPTGGRAEGQPADMPPCGASQYETTPYETPRYGVQHNGYRTSAPKGLSIAALVCGIAAIFTGGFMLIPQVLAVIFGHLALRREPSGKALALTGLIIGYVMVLLTVLVVVLFVALIGFAATTAP